MVWQTDTDVSKGNSVCFSQAENHLGSHIVTVYTEIEFIIRISPFEEIHFSQLTLKIEPAGPVETSVHIIAYKIVI